MNSSGIAEVMILSPIFNVFIRQDKSLLSTWCYKDNYNNI